MSNAMKVMLVLALCLATAAFAQQQLPAAGASQTPTYPDAGATKGVNKFGALPTGATGMSTTNGYALDAGQQFNSKWGMVNGNHDLTPGNTAHTVAWSVNAANGSPVAQSAICAFCHTAHDNEGTADRTWLWAHDVPATSTYGVYSSPTLQAGPITYDATSTTAKCLGCHDGTIGVSAANYGTPAATTAELTIAGTQITSGGLLQMTSGLVVPLNRTHPVGFTYDATLAAKHQLRVPAGNNSVDGYGIIPLFGPGGNQMECATCHDPHLNSGIMRRQFPTGATQDKGTGSFCLYCHL